MISYNRERKIHMFKAGYTSTVVALALAIMACGSNKADEPSAGTTEPAAEVEKPAAPTAGEQAAEPGADQAAPAKEEIMKTMELPKLEANAPLQMDVPEGVAIDNATADFVKLKGAGMELLIEVPAEGIVSLEDERGLLAKPGVEKLVDEELPDGEALAYRANGELHAIVARPKLGVLCSGAALKSDADARRVVEICKTLRAAAK